MKAIETFHSGYHFRSRLEARWAVFFDVLGIEYHYEKEGYDLDGLWYLPDFWLPQYQSWLEVKGDIPDSTEYKKARLLCDHSNKWVYMAVGEIKIPTRCSAQEALDGQWTAIYSYDPLINRPGTTTPSCPLNAWCECPYCHKIEITQDGLTRLLSCSCHQNFRAQWMAESDLQRESGLRKMLGDEKCEELQKENRTRWDNGTNIDSPRLLAAFTAARQARFSGRE